MYIILYKTRILRLKSSWISCIVWFEKSKWFELCLQRTLSGCLREWLPSNVILYMYILKKKKKKRERRERRNRWWNRSPKILSHALTRP